jgi:hypothetical protein
MTALLPIVAGALLLLASRAKAATGPVSYPDDFPAPNPKTKKKHVRVERREHKRGPLQPPLKPHVAAKRVKVVQAAKARAVAVDTAEKLTAKRAAVQLRGHLALTGDYGLGTPVPRIAALQKWLGVPQTGTVDKATRERCLALGVPLPGGMPQGQRTVTRGVTTDPGKREALTGKVIRLKSKKLQLDQGLIPDKGRGSKFEATGKSVTPAMAAERLGEHFRRSGSPGFKGAPSADVARGQRSMAGGIAVDGLYGEQTRGRAAALGVSLPPRAQTVAGFKAATGPAAKPAAAAATPQAQNDPALAARALGAYLGKGGSPGTRAAPAKAISDAQRGMGGGLATDGIYGEQTRGRAAALGVELGPRSQYVKAG